MNGPPASEQLTAIYVRVSTTKVSQKDSPEHQEGVCREKARQLGLQVQDAYIYEDRDTGTNIIGRPAIRQLIRDAQARLFGSVVFASLSRFSRDTMDSLALKRTLVDSLGMRLISLDEGYDSQIDRDELKFQIISAVNQKVSEQISTSSRRGIRQSALKGNFTGSLPPYGYRKTVIGGRRTLVPDEETSGIVRLIYDLYTIHKLGEKQIVNHLNHTRGIPSPKGGLWGVTSIQRILTNEAYTGAHFFGKYESRLKYNNIHDLSDRKKMLVSRNRELWESSSWTHEALISPSQFEDAQELRLLRGGGRRGGIRNRVNPFAGLMKCGHCGASVVLISSRGSAGRDRSAAYRYLACSRRRRQGDAGCTNRCWLPYPELHASLLGVLSARMTAAASPEELLARHLSLLTQAPTAAGKQDRRRLQLEKQIEQYRRLLSQLRVEKMSQGIDEKQYAFEKQQYEAEILEKEAELAGWKEEPDGEQAARELQERGRLALEKLLRVEYDPLSCWNELSLILGKLIERIDLFQDGTVEVRTTFRPNAKDPE